MFTTEQIEMTIVEVGKMTSRPPWIHTLTDALKYCLHKTKGSIEDHYYYLVDKWDDEGLSSYEEVFKEGLYTVLEGDFEENLEEIREYQ